MVHLLLAALLVTSPLAGAPARPAPANPTPAAARSQAPAHASARAYEAYLRGLVAEQVSDWRGAASAYREAVATDPATPSLRVALAEALMRTGDLAQASVEARKAVDLDPSGPAAPEGWLMLGRTAALAHRTAEAEEAFRNAISAQLALASRYPPGQAPLDPDPWRLLAQLKLDTGDEAGAVAALDDLARHLPVEGGLAFRELGRIRAEHGDLDGAEVLYRKSLAAERRDTETWRRLAQLEESRRKFDEARKAWQGLVREDSDDTEALVALGRLALRSNDLPGAKAFFEQAILVAPDDLDVRARVAFAWLDARRAKEAIAATEGGPRLRGDPRMLYVRGLALREERRYDESAEAFAAVRTDDPDLELSALAARASVLAQAGKGAEALRLVDEALATHPDDVRLVTTRGYVLERSGRAAEAVKWLQEALARTPESERVLLALGIAQERAGDRAGSVRTMEAILAKAPDDADALNFVGYSLVEKGERLDEAERMIRRALEIEPDNGSYLDSLGWLLYRRGDVSGAIATLERAEALAGPEPTILEHLGDAYRRAGRDSDAATAWRRAVKALDDGAEPDVPDQRAGIETKLRDLPGGGRPARR